MKYKFAALVLLAVLLFAPLRSAAASGPQFDGQVIFGQSYTLASGETLTGDLLVFGGTAEIQEGATVQGSVVLFGGDLIIHGEVSGDVSATGARVTLGPTAHIGGDLVTVGATLDRADTARVDGQVYNTATSWGDTTAEPMPTPEAVPPQPERPEFHFDFGILGSVMNTIWQSLGLAGLAMLAMLFLARQAERVAQAAVDQPLIAGGIGLLTLLVAPLALVILSLTLVLFPIALLAVIALLVAGLFGWIALGYEVGQRLTKALHWSWHPSLSAGLGILILSLASAALMGIPGLNCVGWILPAIASLAGFGAVVMTRFGTQSVAVQAEKSAETLSSSDAGGANPA
jgi:cytoskeletal protein CcmA (bactofilin family)